MKKFYGFYTMLSAMMILIITTSAGAFFTDDGKGFYGNEPFVKASTTLRDREEVPEGLTKTGWGKISASIELDRYRLQKDDRTGEYQASNHAHDLNATFTREGFEVSPRKGEKGWNWGLSLSKYGYGSDLHAVPVTEKMITKDNRIEYHRGDMVEWYINDHRGLEQGFTLKARPSGRTGSGLLQLQMTTATNLLPVVEKEGKGIIFRDAQDKEVLRYSGLYAYDAAGKNLDARMAANQEGIRLIVTDHEAVYPITIDPFIERKKLLADDGAAGDHFGLSVSISGDTATVGAYGDDDNGDDSGSAYIFSRNQGGADNWGQVKKLTAGDGAAGDTFGLSVSISGDTATVGAYGDDGYSGSAYIFSRDQGGAVNWGQVQKLTAGDGAAGDYFGRSVSISGDTAIVGAYGDDDNGDRSGSAYSFSRDQGGTDNWGEVKKLTAGDGAAYDNFGYSVSISGDTAIVGALWDGDNGDASGSAYIFSVPAFGDELAVDFGGNGLWHYNGSGWASLASWNPDGMAEWNGGLAVNFGASYGLWNYDGTIWSQLAGWEAEYGIAWSSGLAIDFGSNGLWRYDGSSWTGLASWNPDGIVEWTGGLAVDFDTFGLWNYDGTTWTQLAAWNPEDDMVNWTDGLAVDFGSNGLWSYDGSSWNSLATWNPDLMVEWTGGLAVDFDTYGTWNYDGTTWTQLAGWNPEDDMVSWTDGIAVDFGSNGLWSYDGSSWTSLATWNPEEMEAWANGLAVDFGVTYGLWNYDGSSWSNLAGWDSEDIIDVDLY